MESLTLYGHTNTLHDKICNEKGNFERTLSSIKKNNKNPITINITKKNFFAVSEIIQLINSLVGTDVTAVSFAITPLETIAKRFSQLINSYLDTCSDARITLLVDDDVYELLQTIQEKDNGKNEKDLLMLLGVIAETVFTGPKQILIDVTNRCNLDCVYCWIHSPIIRNEMYQKPYYKKAKEIDPDTFKRLVNDAHSIGVDEIVFVGDGEPTIHSRFFELLHHLKQYGLNSRMYTNGLLFEKYYKQLAQSGMKNIEITISAANQKTYQALHPTSPKESFKKLTKGIKKLTQYKKDHNIINQSINIVNVINNKNYTQLIPMVRYAKDVGAQILTFKLIDLREFSKHLKLDKHQIERIRKDLPKAERLANRFGIHFSHNLSFQMENVNAETGNWSEDYYLKKGCLIGWWFAYYRLNDIFTYCCSIKEVDRLRDQTFKEIWFSDNYNDYRIAGKYIWENKDLRFKDNRKLYESKCNNCDNTHQLNVLDSLLDEYGLKRFVYN